MITTGLVRELHYISKVLNIAVKAEISSSEIKIDKILLVIENDLLSIYYYNKLIWRENLTEDSFFGIESCDTISRIITCLNQNNSAWKDYVFIQDDKPLDVSTNH